MCQTDVIRKYLHYGNRLRCRNDLKQKMSLFKERNEQKIVIQLEVHLGPYFAGTYLIMDVLFVHVVFFAFSDLSTTSLLSRSVPSNSYASAASPPILQDGSSSPMSSTSGASSLGSSWTPRGQLQPSPPGLHSSRATPTASSSSVQQAVANLTEAEALLQLSHCQESDEGIVSDQSSVADPEDPTAKRSKVRINKNRYPFGILGTLSGYLVPFWDIRYSFWH